MNGLARASGIVWTLPSVALVWAKRLVKLPFTRRIKSLKGKCQELGSGFRFLMKQPGGKIALVCWYVRH